MKILKRLLAAVLSLSVILPSASIVNAAESYEEKIYADTVFSDASYAQTVSDCVILSLGFSCGFINNVKSKIDNGENMAPYKVSEEIYIPAAYTARGMGLEVIEEDGKITIGDKVYSYDNGEVKSGTVFVGAEKFCEDLDFSLAVADDIIVISPKDKPFDTTNAKIMDSIKTACSYEWESYQIHAYGFTTGIFVHPKNPNNVWVRTDVGGVYKLDLKNDKWICKTDAISGWNENGVNMLYHQPVESFAFDPNDENTMYIAVGSSQFTYDMLGAVYKTTDGGNSWKMTGLRKVMYGSHPQRMNGELLAVDPNNSNIVYCGTYYDGLWRSEDGGDTWSYISSIANGVRGTHDFACATVIVDGESEVVNGASSVVYASVTSNGIYQSTDGGLTFNLMPGSPKAAARMSIIDGVLYVASGVISQWVCGTDTASNGFFKYKNGKWENIVENASISNKAIGSFYIDEKNPDIMVIAARSFTFPRQIYRTLNGGKSWDAFTESDSNSSNISDIVKDPNNENGILIAWGFGVTSIPDITAKSLEYNLYDAGIEELMFREIRCLPEGSKLNWVSTCCDKGCILGYSDGTWERAKNPTWNFPSGTDFCESDPNIIVRAHIGHNAAPGKIIASSDSGDSWKELKVWSDALTGNVAVGATKQANGWPVVLATTRTSGKAHMYRTLDFGETWEELDVPFQTNDRIGQRYLVSDRVNGNVFYYLAADGFFYRSMNGGTTWNKISSVVNSRANAEVVETPFGEEGHIWAVGGKNGLMMSEDYGVHWSNISGVDDATSVTFGKAKNEGGKPTVFFMGVYKGERGFFRSDDYGKTWVSIGSSFHFGGSQNQGYDPMGMSGDRTEYGKLWFCTNGRGIFYAQPKAEVKTLPTISLENEDNSTVYEKMYTVKGRMNVTAEVRVNNNAVELSQDGYFSTEVELSEGKNTVTIEAADEDGNFANPIYLNVTYDPSYINIDFDEEDYKSKKDNVTVKGTINRNAELFVNGVSVPVNEDLTFAYLAPLTLGDNKITFTAKVGGYEKSFDVSARYDNEIPVIEYTADTEVFGEGAVISGKLNEPGEVRINGKEVRVYSDNTFKYLLNLKYGENTFAIQARDIVGNVAKPVIGKINAEPLTDRKMYDGDIPYAGDGFKLSGDVKADFGELPYTCRQLYLGETRNVVTFGMKWDEEALYIGVDVYDDLLMADGTNYYDRDCIEVYLDANNEKVDSVSKATAYTQFMVPYTGDMSPADKMERISKVTEYGYTMEIKIPWKNVGGGTSVKPGHQIGIDIDCCDTSAKEREAQVGWIGTSDSYRRTDIYATMTLVK